jgi:two-component system NtrC family sensor kinase
MDNEWPQGTAAEQGRPPTKSIGGWEAAGSRALSGDGAPEGACLQDMVLRSEKLATLGQVVAGVAHELNNPLTAITGFADLLLRRPDLPEPVRRSLERIASEAVRSGKLVRSLLTIARDHEPVRGPCNLHDVLRETLELLAYRLRATDVQVVEDYAPDLPAVHGDVDQLQQVFLNLIINAQQAMEWRSDKRLVIQTRAVIRPEHDGRPDRPALPAAQAVQAVVSDTGPGIPPALLVKIFEPFFTTKEPRKGTGLGLSVSRSIVVAHGGRLYAESDEGKGASFYVELPVKDERRETRDERHDEKAGSGSWKVGGW